MSEITVCVWTRPSNGWQYWDDAEDHGGTDRVSPRGPFASDDDLRADYRAAFPRDNIIVEWGMPDHYGYAPDDAELYEDLPNEPITAWRIFPLSDSMYRTVWTITRKESGGPCQFNGVYAKIDIAKKAVTRDIDQLDGIYNIGDYELREVVVYGEVTN
jgi:hypothetical protein